ncbi:PREDICTED: melanoma antigen preferentially expressed in tumors-like [Elephantulus edwardii]|uniref:melanoma antigen preferentially expressed in tumors-like n=1 Tax=Elephantulus edwardii TaxID=28737 RepID=UPI0003F0BD83|nr:PREDICTED: melanoma antigen preferentially expressed in tumors-like [Elephantulus edwardii]
MQGTVDPRQQTGIMNTSHPHHLFDLAKHGLLKDESWVPWAPQLIPFRLWEYLFVEAVSGRHRETVEAMSVFKGLEVLLDRGFRRPTGHLIVVWPTTREEDLEPRDLVEVGEAVSLRSDDCPGKMNPHWPADVNMNTFHLHSLFDLAMESLFKDESWVTVAQLPIPFHFWKDVFHKAVSNGCTAIVAAMVAACPLACLDLAILKEEKQNGPLTMLSSVLKGLSVLQDLGPPRASGPLRVLLPTALDSWLHKKLTTEPRGSLDLQKARQTPRERKSEDCSKSPPRHPVVELELVGDLSFKMTQSNELLTFLRRRVQEGKVLPLLCCQKVTFSDDLPKFPVIEKILGSVRLDRVEELRIYHTEDRRLLSMLAPYLPRMVHLRTLQLQSLVVKQGSSRQRRLLARWNTDEELDGIFTELTSQLTHLRQLQHLRLSNVYLCGNVREFLRHLECPLKSLTISSIPCSLENSDVESLSLYTCTSRLRALTLSKTNMEHINANFLRAAIDWTSASLESLDLTDCGLLNFHLSTIIPALSNCSKLQLFRFSGNLMCKATLKRMLRQILPSGKSRHLVLPLPHDCGGDVEDPLVFLTEMFLFLEQLEVLSYLQMRDDQVSFDVLADVLME